jgi:sugar phosphate isomerase/epimerase
MEPGSGDIDFAAAFRALRDVGFKGFMAYECGIQGDTNDERAKTLEKSLKFVRGCIAKAEKP